MKARGYVRLTSILTVFLLLTGAVNAAAQGRMTDKDVENTMKNLKDDAKKFRSAFNSSIGKSTIRKTSQEKDAKALAEQFERQTEAMLKQFQDKKKADAAMQAVLSTRDQLDKTMKSVSFDSKTTETWSRVNSELDALSKAFSM